MFGTKEGMILMRDEKAVLIGENIRRFRRRKDYSQENIAEELNVSLSTFSRMEKGITSMNVLQLLHLAAILEVSVEEILEGV